MANLTTFSDLQTYLGNLVGDTNIDTTLRNNFLNQSYEKVAYSHPWPFMKRLYAKRVLAYESNYDLPSDWREFDTLRVLGTEYKEVDREQLRKNNNVFYIERKYDQIIVNPVPTTDQDMTTVTNIESAGSDVTIEVANASIFAVGDEAFINHSTLPQTIIISAVDTTNNTITATLDQVTAAANQIWVLQDGIWGEYFITVTALSGDSDEPIVPTWIRPRIVEFAAHLYFNYIEDANKAAIWLSTFNQRMIEHWHDAQFSSNMAGIKFGIKE